MSVSLASGSSSSCGASSVVGSSRACDICDCKKFEVIGRTDRHGYPLETVICWRCGVVSHASIPTDDELAKFYEHEYRPAYNGEATPSARRVVREWKRGQQRFDLLKPHLRAGDRVFEIGAGIGCNLKQFELAGHEAAGIEPGVGFSEFSRDQMRCDIRTGWWQELPATPSYDFLLLIHVLEHLNAPTQALRHLHQMLKPGGRLYVEVPNLAAPHAAPGKQFHYAHIYNYTPWTLAMLARSCGFETELLCDERDRNLAMLLKKSDKFVNDIDPQSYLKTREALHRYSRLSYYLRPSYLTERAKDLWRFAVERRQAKSQFAEILALCATTPRKTVAPMVDETRVLTKAA